METVLPDPVNPRAIEALTMAARASLAPDLDRLIASLGDLGVPDEQAATLKLHLHAVRASTLYALARLDDHGAQGFRALAKSIRALGCGLEKAARQIERTPQTLDEGIPAPGFVGLRQFFAKTCRAESETLRATARCLEQIPGIAA